MDVHRCKGPTSGMNRLVEQDGLHWMVNRICELRGAGETAAPRFEWKMVQGQIYVAFVVVRADGTFERPSLTVGEPEVALSVYDVPEDREILAAIHRATVPEVAEYRVEAVSCQRCGQRVPSAVWGQHLMAHLRGEHPTLSVEEVLVAHAQPECTGFAATWCPIHGDCRCPKEPDGSRNEDEPEGCPLHADDSAHGWTDDAGLHR